MNDDDATAAAATLIVMFAVALFMTGLCVGHFW
jgi:hypothetical protein